MDSLMIGMDIFLCTCVKFASNEENRKKNQFVQLLYQCQVDNNYWNKGSLDIDDVAIAN